MTTGQTAGTTGGVVMSYAGLWRRTLLVDVDGTRDTSTVVRWLQGATAFVDLRRRPPRPDFAGVRAAADLTAAQRDWLATQDGFAGWLGQHSDVVEWSRFVNLQPPGPHPDAGRMAWQGDTLIETGVHADYVEHWVRDDSAEAAPWALSLGYAGDGEALLVRVGDHFGWAQRATSRPVEISLGRVDGVTWTITDSALPYREGRSLAPRLDAGELCVADVEEDGSARLGRWSVTDSEGFVDL